MVIAYMKPAEDKPKESKMKIKAEVKAPRLKVPAPKVQACPKKKASKTACRKWRDEQ
jgi:hypothetical protein